jgi:hypothetical protein
MTTMVGFAAPHNAADDAVSFFFFLFSKVFGIPKRFASKSFYPSLQKGFKRVLRAEP